MGKETTVRTQVKEFLNPYNFIPFPEKRAKAYPPDKKKHTGVIEYTITTRSPLFIPNTSNNKAFSCNVLNHDCYDFYSYTSLDEEKTYENEYFEPVIPGSELRGMIRSIYETLTDSCMGVLNEDTYPIMRISEAYKAGLLKREKDNSFSLVEAEDCIYQKKDDKDFFSKLYEQKEIKEGSKVYFTKVKKKGYYKPLISSIEFTKVKPHQDAGYLIKGMPGGVGNNKKISCHVFIPQKEKLVGKLTENDLERLREVINAYQSEPGISEQEEKKPYAQYKKALEAFLKGNAQEEYFPVYYSKIQYGEEKIIYLAPACFTKEPSAHSLKELAGEFASCKKVEKSCPCCDLFGMVGENNEEARASKLRFADAKALEKNSNKIYYDHIVTLETLGKPRINNVEFYLKKPGENATFWNYDYYIEQNELRIQMGELRGRKYYWHQKGKKLRNDIEKTKLNKSVRPVKSGVCFNGKLFFEGISDKQLQQLLWVLNGGNEEEQNHNIAYKLGMGKPLGLGSVELKVTKVEERILEIKDKKINYKVETKKDPICSYDGAGFSKTIKDDFFTICSLDATEGKLVTYPIVDGQQDQPMKEGFKWFVKNHGFGMKTNRKQMVREYPLPPIKNVETLPLHVKGREYKKKSNTSKRRSH